VGAEARAAKPPANPFAYDITKFRTIDPKWLHYQQVAQFKVPRSEARRVAIGPDQNLYVSAGNYVCVLNTAGQRLNEFALPSPVRCVAVAGDGLVYVSLRDHLEVLDSKGQRRASWESPNKKTWFTGLAVGDNDLFAADSGNRVVLRYDRSGKLLKRIGEKNPDRNIPGFVLPSPFLDVELHPDGLLRVNNPGRHQVLAFTVEGDMELAWGKPTMAIEGFCGCCNPIALAILPGGRIVTCEKGLPRVKVYSVRGELESVVAGPATFADNAKACDPTDCTTGGLDAVADRAGRIYVLDPVANDLRVFARRDGPTASSQAS
jgi:sugar lactone lactonase YvrE